MAQRTNTRRQHEQRKEYREQCAAADAPCWLCGLPIDYAAAYDDYGNDDRFQEDHFFPVSTHPHLQEDPTNKRPSHAGCNRDRSNGAPASGLGVLSREWA
jgi:5-methylcytosine-specific restriction endonuclease McrA